MCLPATTHVSFSHFEALSHLSPALRGSNSIRSLSAPGRPQQRKSVPKRRQPDPKVVIPWDIEDPSKPGPNLKPQGL